MSKKKKTVPNKSQSKIKLKVNIRKDAIRKDGTAPVYINLAMSGERKKLYIDIYISPDEWDYDRNRAKGRKYKDVNIYIEKIISQIYKIEFDYRMMEQPINLDKLVEEVNNPTARRDFVAFWQTELEKQQHVIKELTYRQQKSTLKILKTIQNPIFFYEINDDLILKIRRHLKKVRGNSDASVNVFLKNFKKYLHIANKSGIKTAVDFSDIKIKQKKSDKQFLSGKEIVALDQYYSSLSDGPEKNILARFLFSCFTGLRISDIQKITGENVRDGYLFVVATKTEKIHRIKLVNSALRYIYTEEDFLFKGKYTDQHINRTIKESFFALGFKRAQKLTFHSARHTFATQWIINGGGVIGLQKTLGHSQIKQTTEYVHLVAHIIDDEIMKLDKIFESPKKNKDC